MDNTLFCFTGATIGRFYIPPFTVSPGEVVIIGFPGGPYFMETVRLMVPLLREISPFTYAKKIGPRMGIWLSSGRSNGGKVPGPVGMSCARYWR